MPSGTDPRTGRQENTGRSLGLGDRPVIRMLLSSCSWASWSAVAATSSLHTNSCALTPMSGCTVAHLANCCLTSTARSLMRGWQVRTAKRVLSFTIATNQQLNSNYQRRVAMTEMSCHAARFHFGSLDMNVQQQWACQHLCTIQTSLVLHTR